MPRYTGKASLGSFGELGGELTFEWDPDPDDVANRLLEVAGYLDDLESPLALSKEVLKEDIGMRFETKVDPDGNLWEPWSENYAKYRETNYPEGGILRRAWALYNTSTRDDAWEQGPAGIFFNTQGLPEYWLWTQEGAERSGASVTRGMTQAEKEHMANSLGITVAELGSAGGNSLPARPFIGASFEAEIQITEIFDKWFDGAIDVATSSKGKIFGRHSYRGPSGQFVSRA